MNKQKLALEQVDSVLSRSKPLLSISVPQTGWIRAIRTTLGMSGRQLAKRLGVNKQSVSWIERNENEGALTIKTMRKVAESLDCVFVYSIIPSTSLEKILRDRAQVIAMNMESRVSHSMRLEEQGLSKKELKKALSHQIDKIIHEMPEILWEN
ncbi:mobile mystery protein A [Chloroflexota bacterium]